MQEHGIFKNTMATYDDISSPSYFPIVFIGENEEIVNVRKPVIMCTDLSSYHEWLATLTERVNKALHPALPGMKINFFNY